MSTKATGAANEVRPHDDVLGYLLKHAHVALEQSSDAALRELGVTARELGLLRVIAGGEARSQQEVAEILDIDRTTMVAFVDTLERRGLVARHPAAHDRRRNVVALTDQGWSVFREAERRAVLTEQAFVACLDAPTATALRHTLRTMLAAHRET